VISHATHDRREGYFRLEWKLAVDRSHLMDAEMAFLLPVVIDDTRDDDERVPERFREVQWTRLLGGVTPPAFVERIRRLLSGEPSKAPTRTASEAAWVSAGPTQQHARASWRSWVALLLTIAVIVAALGYLVANRLAQSGHIAPPGVPAGSATPAASATVFNPPPHSIAVLPFVNMSGDPRQEYFSDGISEELLNALSRVNDLQVEARTSSFSFKGQNVDVSTIAHKLNVGAVLEGSVRRAGNTVRITVQLINAVSGFHMWSQTYDRNLTDILKVQSEVATAVAQQLEIKLVGDEAAQLELGGTQNPKAYDAYLHGLQLLSTWDTAKQSAALAAFDQAITLDHNYALAYVGRSAALGNMSMSQAKAEARASLGAQGLEAAQRAVSLAPDLGDAYVQLAETRAWIFLDFAGAAPEFERALALAPGSVRVQKGYAWFSSQLGHFEVALNAARRSVDLDPQNFQSHTALAQILFNGRHFAEALTALQRAELLNPGSHFLTGWKVSALLASGQVEKVRDLCQLPSTPLDEDARHRWLALAYHALGHQADAERELKQLQELDKNDWPFSYAEIYAQWGETALALQWLKKAEQLRDPSFQQLRVDWMLDPIRNEPQFKAIEARMKFPP
jgi:TolB-like protein